MSFHQGAQRFAFDRVFSAPLAEGTARSPIELELEIQSLKDQIRDLEQAAESARIAARAEGFEAGLAQARAERDTALLSAVDALQGSIETIEAQFGETQARLTGEATEVALAAAELLAARALERMPEAAIDDAIGRVLAQVARGTELQVRVNPDMIDAVEARIAERQSLDRRRMRITVVGDVTLPRGDAVIGWEQGSLALDGDARKAAIMAELETLLPSAPTA